MEKIKRATLQDAALLIRLRLDFIESAVKKLTEEEKTSLSEKLREYYSVYLNNGTLCACYLEKEDRIVSVAFLVINHFPPSPSFPNGLSGTILNVLTYPEFQKRGYGTQVLNAVIDYAKEKGISCLELHATEEGYRLYEKSGFKPSPYCSMILKL